MTKQKSRHVERKTVSAGLPKKLSKKSRRGCIALRFSQHEAALRHVPEDGFPPSEILVNITLEATAHVELVAGMIGQVLQQAGAKVVVNSSSKDSIAVGKSPNLKRLNINLCRLVWTRAAHPAMDGSFHQIPKY
jgi:hypothetical protein